MEEKWKKIKEIPGYYVSNLGNIKRDVPGGGQIPVRQYVQRFPGKKSVSKISVNMKRYVQQFCVHIIVARYFLKGSGKFVFHKDGNQLNNAADNLYYSDKLEKFNNMSKRKPVRQLSLAGVLVEEFESITDASEKTGLSASRICACCKGKTKSSNGYKWEYM